MTTAAIGAHSDNTPSAFEQSLSSAFAFVKGKKSPASRFEQARHPGAMAIFGRTLFGMFQETPDTVLSTCSVQSMLTEMPEQLRVLLISLLQHAEQIEAKCPRGSEWEARVLALQNAIRSFGGNRARRKKVTGRTPLQAASEVSENAPFAADEIDSNLSTVDAPSWMMSTEELVSMHVMIADCSSSFRERFRQIVALGADDALEQFRTFWRLPIRFPELHAFLIELVTHWTAEILEETPESMVWTRVNAWGGWLGYRHRRKLLNERQRVDRCFGRSLQFANEKLQPPASKARCERRKQLKAERRIARTALGQ